MLRPRFPFREEVFGGILYDTRTEDYFHLNPSAFSLLKFLDAHDLPEAVPDAVQKALEEFREQGLVQDRSDGGRMLRGKLIHDRPRVLSAPTIVEVYPNFTCNERCEFCYVGTEVESALPEDTIPRAKIPVIADKLARAGVFNVTLLGGEPFLYRSLDVLIEELARQNLDVSLSTNGTILNGIFLEAVAKYDVKLNVALHGPDAETHNAITRSDSFSKVLRFIEACSSHGISPHVTTVMHPKNESGIDDVVGLVSKLGITSMTVSYPQPSSYTKARGATVPFSKYAAVFRRAFDAGRKVSVKVRGNCHYNFLLREYGSGFDTNNPLSEFLYGDKAGRSRLEMTPSGDLYPTSTVFGRQEFKVANLFSDDLLDAWANSPVLQHIRDRDLPVACQDCGHHDVCGGGIIGERLADNEWDLPPEDCPVLNEE